MKTYISLLRGSNQSDQNADESLGFPQQPGRKIGTTWHRH